MWLLLAHLVLFWVEQCGARLGLEGLDTLIPEAILKWVPIGPAPANEYVSLQPSLK